MKTQTLIIIMGIFGLFGKQSREPYKAEELNQVYELLFCDNLELFKTADDDSSTHPWNVLFSESSDFQLNELINSDSTESRVKILANHKLKQKTDPKTLLGVIIEVHLPEGLDVLAAYSDGTARYINHSERAIIWDTKTEESEQLIQKLFKSSHDVVSQIGPWEAKRLKFPKKGNARLTFLVSDQIYFGEAPVNILTTDPKGEQVMNDGAMLMLYLMEEIEKGEK